MSGLRERKKEETRCAFTAAAEALFRTQGYEATTIEQIAAAVTLSPRTFHRYFDSKEAVLFGDWRQQLATLVEQVLARPADEPPLTTCRLLALQVAMDVEADRPRQRFIKAIVQSSPSAGEYERSVVLPEFERALGAALARRGGVDPALDAQPGLLAAVAIATMRLSKARWMQDGTEPLPTLVDAAFETLAAAFAGSRPPPVQESR